VNTTLLLIGSVVSIVAIIAVLAGYLYKVGSVVNHIAQTLEEKIADGAQEVSQHVTAMAPAAAGLRHELDSLAR
jgi:hypothetical protein